MQIVVGLWSESGQADLEVAERHNGVAEQRFLVHLVGDALRCLVEEQGDVTNASPQPVVSDRRLHTKIAQRATSEAG